MHYVGTKLLQACALRVYTTSINESLSLLAQWNLRACAPWYPSSSAYESGTISRPWLSWKRRNIKGVLRCRLKAWLENCASWPNTETTKWKQNKKRINYWGGSTGLNLGPLENKKWRICIEMQRNFESAAQKVGYSGEKRPRENCTELRCNVGFATEAARTDALKRSLENKVSHLLLRCQHRPEPGAPGK